MSSVIAAFFRIASIQESFLTPPSRILSDISFRFCATARSVSSIFRLFSSALTFSSSSLITGSSFSFFFGSGFCFSRSLILLSYFLAKSDVSLRMCPDAVSSSGSAFETNSSSVSESFSPRRENRVSTFSLIVRSQEPMFSVFFANSSVSFWRASSFVNFIKCGFLIFCKSIVFFDFVVTKI